MKIKVNYDNENLWCSYSKERINIGEKYVEKKEIVLDETIIKNYKLDNAPTEDDEDDVWISPSE